MGVGEVQERLFDASLSLFDGSLGSRDAGLLDLHLAGAVLDGLPRLRLGLGQLLAGALDGVLRGENV